VSFGSIRKEGEEESKKEKKGYEGEYEGECDVEYFENFENQENIEREDEIEMELYYEEEYNDEEDEREGQNREEGDDDGEYYYDEDYYDEEYYDDEEYYEEYEKEDEDEKKERNIENKYRKHCEDIVNKIEHMSRQQLIESGINLVKVLGDMSKKHIQNLIISYIFRFCCREDCANELFSNNKLNDAFKNTVWKIMKENYHTEQLKSDIMNLYFKYYSHFDLNELEK
jgi:hypothetical protein